MAKILAVVFLVVFLWYAIPLAMRGLWIAPTAYPDSWWGTPMYQYDPQVAQDGYGWFNADIRKPATAGQTTANVFNSL